MRHSHFVTIFYFSRNNYRCEIPSCENGERTYLTPWLNISTPFVANLPEKCFKYEELVASENASCSIESFNRSVIVECRNNFIYEDDEITIQNEVSIKHLSRLFELNWLNWSHVVAFEISENCFNVFYFLVF